MKDLYEYLINQQIQNDLSFLTEDEINEGKIKDNIKKAWNWLKGKFKKGKNKKTINNTQYTFNIYNYSQVYQKIYKNNELKKGIDIVDDGYDDKYKIVLAEDEDKNAVGCLFYIMHNKYDRPAKFIEYEDYDHIFSMQIDKNYFNKGISEELLKKVVSECEKYSSYKGITLDIHEYNTKPNLYKKYFEVKDVKKDKIAIYKQ